MVRKNKFNKLIWWISMICQILFVINVQMQLALKVFDHESTGAMFKFFMKII